MTARAVPTCPRYGTAYGCEGASRSVVGSAYPDDGAWPDGPMFTRSIGSWPDGLSALRVDDVCECRDAEARRVIASGLRESHPGCLVWWSECAS